MEWLGKNYGYDILSKTIYKNGVKIWFDSENQIGDKDYYETYEDWVMENT